MQLQDLSYKLNNQKIYLNTKELGNFQVSAEIFSFENVYTAKEGSFANKNGVYFSDKILWGDTEPANGNLIVETVKTNDGYIIKSQANLDKEIRGIKLRFDNLPLGVLISSVDCDKQVTERGLLINYPEGWRSPTSPLLVFALDGGGYLYLRSLDKTVNKKRFFIKKYGDKMRIDFVQENHGDKVTTNYCSPDVECGFALTKEEIFKRQSDYIKEIYALEDYETSSIVPKWFKDVSLVVIMHMEAFTGHIFHTYESAYKDIAKLCDLIDGKRILVYFAGWEGRYYYKYGDYTPDERLGGGEKLKECVQKIQSLGCKTMAMYGMNVVNKYLPTVKDMIDEAEYVTASGGRFHCGSVNWEGGHNYDFGQHVQLNIANKKWQDCLYNQIKDASLKYGFDGAFLDIAASYVCDKRADVYTGVVEFCNRLRDIKPEFLVSGEGYYDGLSKAMPLFQSGHTDGRLHYHDRVSDELFTRYSREFSHLCLGDLYEGSSGVHELGINTETTAPLRKAIIPTISLVNDTMEKAYDQVKEVAEMAKEYARRYLGEKKDK